MLHLEKYHMQHTLIIYKQNALINALSDCIFE